MKVEGTEVSVTQENYAGKSPQVHNKLVTHVLVGGVLMPIEEGSFALHRTPGGGTPFARFRAAGGMDSQGNDEILNFELFPSSLQAVAYKDVISDEADTTDE